MGRYAGTSHVNFARRTSQPNLCVWMDDMMASVVGFEAPTAASIAWMATIAFILNSKLDFGGLCRGWRHKRFPNSRFASSIHLVLELNLTRIEIMRRGRPVSQHSLYAFQMEGRRWRLKKVWCVHHTHFLLQSKMLLSQITWPYNKWFQVRSDHANSEETNTGTSDREREGEGELQPLERRIFPLHYKILSVISEKLWKRRSFFFYP